ncbi:MAG TPA: HlyD family efflux transporter periplasmic adaptor subunit [Gemmatimonadaceae bacterium]|nr:HlyD family efflux transporter periplasmic adaptor subunit [Gemmatimonadaceae bacterium]
MPLAVVALAACRGDDASTVDAHGTVEVVEVDVAPMTAARLLDVRVGEGDSVHAGDTLALLTQATLHADIEQRRARVAAAEAALRDLTAGARPAEVERADAELRAADAEAARTARDLERLAALAAAHAISEQQLDAAASAAKTAAGRRDAAAEALRLLREGARPQRISGARADLATARGALDAALATASDLTLLAPVSGTIMHRHAEPGEVLQAGEAVLTVGEVRRPWVRVFVREHDVPNVRVGASAVAVLDGPGNRSVRGRVVSINERAEFTPRVALTEDERADLVFGVKVVLDDSTGMVKAGLPVTVRIDTEGAVAAARTP